MKTIRIMAILLVLIVLGMSFYLIYPILHHRMKPRTATIELSIVTEYAEQPTDWKEQLENLINIKHTMKIEKLPVYKFGECNLFTRTIKMQENLQDFEFVLGYAHELVHLKYYTLNDTFAEYKSTILLYESGLSYFRNIALANVNYIVNDKGYINTDYDCGWYLQEYFKENV